MSASMKTARGGGRGKARVDYVGAVRCPRCAHRLPPLVAASSVRLAEAAAQAGKGEAFDSGGAAAALVTDRRYATRKLRLAVADGLLAPTRTPLPRGGFAYYYAPTRLAAAYVFSDSLAQRLRALARLAPARHLGRAG